MSSWLDAQMGLYSAYVSLGAMAVGSVYAGSFGSLKTPKSTKALLRKARLDAKLPTDLEGDDEVDDDLDASELLNLQDAYWFPVFGSGALLSLWLLFKYASPEVLNLLLGLYFAVFGSVSIGKYLADGINILSCGCLKGNSYKLTLSDDNKGSQKATETSKKAVADAKSDERAELQTLKFSTLSVSTLLVGIALSTIWFTFGRHPVLNNLLGLAFAYNAITLLHLDSFVTGSILLAGLFFYDIFWVYGTPVMVSVAKNVDAPIKLVAFKDAGLSSLEKLIPAWLMVYLPIYRNSQIAMLGLGDIVLPGIYIALALRYDLHRHTMSHLSLPAKSKANFPKPYFYTSIVFYFLGLLSTVVLMHITQRGTPALLFLSPAAILAVTLTALVQRDWFGIWAFKIDPPSEEKPEDGKSQKRLKAATPKKSVGQTKKDSSAESEETSLSNLDETSTPRRRSARTVK